MGARFGFRQGVAGYFGEVENGADLAIQPRQDRRGTETAGLDEVDGEAQRAGGVFRTMAGATTAAIFIPAPIPAMMGAVSRRQWRRFPFSICSESAVSRA